MQTVTGVTGRTRNLSGVAAGLECEVMMDCGCAHWLGAYLDDDTEAPSPVGLVFDCGVHR